MSRGPKNRGGGRSGTGSGRGYVGGTRPPAPPRPATDGASGCGLGLLLALVHLAVYLAATATH